MNMRKTILLLGLGLALPVVALRSQSSGVPPVAMCGTCLCITPGSVVTIPDGQCGVTAPGGDSVAAVGGPVTVSTDVTNAFTAVVVAAGAHADVDVSGPASFDLIGGGAASAVVDGHGLTLDVTMPDGTLVLTGTGNTGHDSNAGPRPARYEATWPGVATNTLEMHAHAGIRVTGLWFVNP